MVAIRSMRGGAGSDRPSPGRNRHDDQVRDRTGRELGQDPVGRAPVVGVVGVRGRQPVDDKRRHRDEPRHDEQRRGDLAVQCPQQEHEQREQQVGQPLHRQGPCHEVPATLRLGTPLLHEQQVPGEVGRVQPVAVEGVAGDLGLGDHGAAGDDEHDDVHGVDAGQPQPPEVQRASRAQCRAEAAQVGVREDEAGEREEQVDAEAADAQHVGDGREAQQSERAQGSLEVVQQHPGRGDEPNAGELADEHVHEGSPRLIPVIVSRGPDRGPDWPTRGWLGSRAWTPTATCWAT